ncbi:MAG TPA: UbiX family flavin prenyltransferase [Candidatus Saccharimonadales bacterium]|nr:UbiX family flavin prenyltransferase [Candidatus Saccharimonadales bacterium]
MSELVLAITGASGSLCGRRLLSELCRHPDVTRVNVVASLGARKVAREELGLKGESVEEFRRAFAPEESARLRWFDEGDLAAPIASGSYPCRAMAVVPCSTGTLASIALGASRNLIHRAAEVTLKERRRLVLGVRESPYTLIHLENMRAATLAGAVIAPITPMFYNRPVHLEEIVEQYTARVMDLLDLPHSIGKRWKADR